MHLNYSDLVLKYPAHLASSVKLYLEKFRHRRTNPISCERTLHTFLSLQ